MSITYETTKNLDIASVEHVDTLEDLRLLRKVDLRLLPILTLLYLLSFLDRSNIGNAKIDGLATDINISGAAYNTSLAIYFIAYVIFEVPANIILKRYDPQFWLPMLTLTWGIASIGQGLITNQAGLFGIRFLLGMTEAGLFPGVIFLFSLYYRRHERHWRVAIFFGGSALAGAFGGILAYAIGKMDGIGGRKGWQWIFILEGLLTVVVSLGAFFIVPTWPHRARFLTDSERTRLLYRLQLDSDAGNYEKFEWLYVRQAFKDHLVWAYALLFHGYSFVLYTLSLFLPTIIADLGFQTWKAQLMTVPPNVVATLSICAAAWLSAKYNVKAPFIIGAAIVAIIGYIVLLTTNTGAQYVGVHFAAMGVYTGCALLLSWPGNNILGQTKRAVGVAMQITIGDLGAVVGVLVYRPNFSAHRYRKPHIIAVGYLIFAISATAYLWFWLSRENKRRDLLIEEAEQREEKMNGVSPEDNVVRLGDKYVAYRYQL